MTPFTIHNQITPGEYTTYFLKRAFRRPVVILYTFLSVAAAIINIGYYYGWVDQTVYFIAPWPFIIFAPVVLLMRFIRARVSYNATPKLKKPVDYTFTEEELKATSEDAEWSYRWGSTVKTRDTKHFLLIFRSANDFEMIRKEGLTPEQLDFIKIKTSKFSI